MSEYFFQKKRIFFARFNFFVHLFFDRSLRLLKGKTALILTVIILGTIGVSRNILEVAIGGEWARGWFDLTPDVFFTMFFYPIFLCFFSTTLLHFFSHLLGLKVEINKLFIIIFFLQFLHLFIPFLDGVADFYNLPYRLDFNVAIYKKLIFSPLALTPLILFFTWPTSFGIDIAWVLVSIVFLYFYIKRLDLSVVKSLGALSLTFYIVYMSIYPIYFFFINEGIVGSNYMFGLFFMFMSIPSLMYVKMMSGKHE